MADAQMAGSGSAACNPQAALARLGDDRELYSEVLQRFFADAPSAVGRISAAIDASNGDALHRAAHSFKGLAAMAGTEEVSRLAAELEQLGRQNQFEAAPPLLARLEQELHSAQRELASYYQ